MAAKTQVGDEAVKKATGRDWAEWLKVLDAEGARKMSHKEIVAVLSEKYGVGPWWQQMVTVGYERERGLRAMHQKADGFSASISRTIAAPVADVFAAFDDGRRRSRWLGEKVTVRRATPEKSMRIALDDETSVAVYFVPKGEKTQVAIEHSKLKDAKAVQAKKAFWSDALARLQEKF